MRIGKWSEPRFVFVCQLVEVIREADANETSGELGLALSGNSVGESQLRIPKLEPDTMLSNIVPLESIELEYHDVVNITVSQYEGVRRHHQMIQRWIVSSCVRACWGHVDVGNDQGCVSQLVCNSQPFQIRIW